MTTAAATTETTTEAPATAWYEPLLASFAASCSTPKTGEGYVRRARGFFKWASEAPRSVKSVKEIPADGVLAWLQSPVAPVAQGTKNVAVGALRAFYRWAANQSLECAAWEFPETPRAPKKSKKKTKSAEESEMSTPAGVPEESETGFEADWGKPKPPLMDRAAFGDAPGLVKPSGAAAPPPPAASEFEEEPMRAPFVDPTVIVGAAPRTTQKRGTRIDPLEVLCPPRGFLRVSRVREGFEPELIGQWQPQNLAAYGDLPDFVERVLKPGYGPRPGDMPVRFLIYRFNEHRDPVGNPHEVTVAAPHGNSGATATDAVTQLQKSMFESLEEMKRKTLEESEQKVSKVVSALEKDPSAGVSLIAEMRDVLKPDLRPVEHMMERFTRDVVAVVQSAAATRPDPNENNVKLLLDRLLPPKGAPGGMFGEAPAAPPVKSPQEALREQAETFKILKEAFGSPAPTGPSAETQAILATLKSIQEEISASRDEDDIERTVMKFKAIKEAAQELGGGGGGGSGLGEFARYMPELMEFGHRALETFAPRIKLTKGGGAQRPAGAGAAPANATVKATPAKPAALPAEVQHALSAIRDAKPGPDYDEEVANALFALIMALRAAGGALGQLHERILERFRAAKIRAQIYALITDTFVALGAEEMLVKDPELADRVGFAIANNYPEIHNTIPGWGEKRLVDQDLEGDDEDEDDEEDDDEEEEEEDEDGEKETPAADPVVPPVEHATTKTKKAAPAKSKVTPISAKKGSTAPRETGDGK